MPKITIKPHLPRLAKLLKALSNDMRLDVLFALLESEKSVGQLLKGINLSQSALSQHLAKLRKEGLVQTRRDAQTIFYSIKSDKTKDFLRSLAKIYMDKV